MHDWIARIGLALGPALCVLVLVAPLPDIEPEARASLAVLVLCATWWLTTPVALPVTSLAGLALLPVLGALEVSEALALFGNPAVFFVIGIFLVAAVMLRTGLSARLTLLVLRRFARSEEYLCEAVLVVSCVSCVLVVSHAVAALMLPIVLEIVRSLDLGPSSRTAKRLLLSMAWGTVCGSNLTLLSSARASLALELYDHYLADLGLSSAIGFLIFSGGSLPIVTVSLLCTGLVLRWSFPPEGLDLAPALRRLDERVTALGPMRRAEWWTLGILGAMVVAMVAAGPAWLSVVAILTSCLLFALRILRWEDAQRDVNWGVVFLYGGAIAVGSAVYHTGGAAWLVDHALLADGPGPWTVIWGTSLLTSGLTEVMSNSAVMAVVLPVTLTMSGPVGLAADSLPWVVSLSAGFAFIFPTSTPALAMVFGTGYVQVGNTLGPGLVLNVVCTIALVLFAWLLWPLVGIPVLLGNP